ncbi:MAG: hemerythrin domain-containing protein [Thermoanaerobaculia bacterium]
MAPESLQFEHRELREHLDKAVAAPGRTGEAAREVVKVLQPHILLETEFAMPPLTLLPKLARGEVTPDMARFIDKTDAFKAELPRMLDEHKLIVGTLRTLLQAATAEKVPVAAQFAQKMIMHAQMEEEVLYPAAILVGEYLRLRMGKG